MKRTLIVMFVLVFIGSFAFAQSNDATVNQYGTNQQADVDQAGDLNKVLINQGRDIVPPHANDKDGKATVDQIGTGNDAEIEQIGGRNKQATIMQVGLLNEALIQQTGTGNYVEATIANQTQNGERNEAKIWQKGRSIRASQEQFGDDNYAFIEQGSYVDANDHEDYAGQYQEGTFNHAEIDQGQSFASPRSRAQQIQIGHYNEAFIYQRGQSGNWAKIDQSGDQNWAGVDQVGKRNTFDLAQLGNENEVFGEDPFETFQQIGDDLVANTMLQQGNNNTIFGGQFGEGHTMHVSQIGNSNTATVNQSN